MQHEYAELTRKAQSLLDANLLNEARDLYIKICELDTQNSSSWGVLGKLHNQLGDSDLAIKCLEYAIDLDPDDSHNLVILAGIQLSSGNIAMASEYCSKAIDAGPDTMDLWWALGDIASRLGNFVDTERCCREMIACDLSFPPAYLYLGIALQRQVRLVEAGEAIQEAIRLRPDFANAYYYLGVVQQTSKKIQDAVQNYRRALDLGFEPGSCLHSISIAQQIQGNWKEALENGFEALRCKPDNLNYRQNFVQTLRAITPVRVSTEILEEIERCFAIKGLDTAALMKPGMVLVMQDPKLQQLVRLACSECEDFIKTGIMGGYYREVFQNSLLKALLSYTKIASLEFEKLTGALRRIALAWVSERPKGLPDGLLDHDVSFLFALASQCFNTEYAHYTGADELEMVNKLASYMGDQLDNDIRGNSELLCQLIVLCMYQPLYTQPWARVFLMYKQTDVGNLLYCLLKTQLFDHVEECRISKIIKSITPISDDVSNSVRQQYEESPYPRWNSVNIYTPVSYIDEIGNHYHGLEPPDIGKSRLELLVAGCGTGRHAIMSATRYKDSEVLAIDLSRMSLAFGERMTRELGISNITFAQADILELGSLGRHFHIIEAFGVLHHMRHPQTGLQILVDLLHDNGVIHIGLYSKHARRDVAAARSYIAELGLEPTPDGIRRARMDLSEMDSSHPAYSVTRFRDFFTLSECRDLLFHVQERQYRLHEVGSLLEMCGLKFLGFTLTDPQVAINYKKQFPDDPYMLNLEYWEKYECENPDTFSDMYQFMCQRA